MYLSKSGIEITNKWMSSARRVRKPFCWHLKCQRLSGCTAVRAENSAGSDSKYFLDQVNLPALPKMSPPSPPLASVEERKRKEEKDREREERKRKRGSKAEAHRFAAISLLFFFYIRKEGF